jgi:hypothetical protein
MKMEDGRWKMENVTVPLSEEAAERDKLLLRQNSRGALGRGWSRAAETR